MAKRGMGQQCQTRPMEPFVTMATGKIYRCCRGEHTFCLFPLQHERQYLDSIAALWPCDWQNVCKACSIPSTLCTFPASSLLLLYDEYTIDAISHQKGATGGQGWV